MRYLQLNEPDAIFLYYHKTPNHNPFCINFDVSAIVQMEAPLIIVINDADYEVFEQAYRGRFVELCEDECEYAIPANVHGLIEYGTIN